MGPTQRSFFKGEPVSWTTFHAHQARGQSASFESYIGSKMLLLPTALQIFVMHILIEFINLRLSLTRVERLAGKPGHMDDRAKRDECKPQRNSLLTATRTARFEERSMQLAHGALLIGTATRMGLSSKAAVPASGSPSIFEGRYRVWKAINTLRVCWVGCPSCGTT
jgi:hypothetical protein